MDAQMYGWCGTEVPATPAGQATVSHSLRSEAAGYFAMLAFLSAYLLNVAGTAHYLQAALNLAGALVAAFYLYTKGAMPSVISNLAWVAITIAGLIVS